MQRTNQKQLEDTVWHKEPLHHFWHDGVSKVAQMAETYQLQTKEALEQTPGL